MASARGLLLRVRRSWLAWPLLLVVLSCSDDHPRASGVPPTGSGGSSGPRPSPPLVSMGSGGSGADGGSAAGAGAGGSGGSGAPMPEDAGVTPDSDASTTLDGGREPRPLRLPPANAGLDYQLGGAYPPPDGVQIVSRDRTESPAPGLYNLCYVNGFQVQPDEESFWLDEHPELVLRDGSGEPVIDADWDELLIDVSTPEKRTAVAAIVGAWIEGCAAAGFDAVEIDNLDSFARSSDLLDEEDAVAAMALFSEAAHARGLAIAQKNSAELVSRRSELGTDFAVAEECNRYAECGVYVDAYDGLVLVIEYRRVDFEDGCAGFPDQSIVLRDLNLTTPEDSAYVYDGC